MSGSASGHRLLEIQTVEIVAGRGRSVTVSSVRCPVRGGAAAAVDECGCCGSGGGIAGDALARGGWLCCGAAAAPRAAGVRVRDAMPPAAVALRTAVSRRVAADALRARGQPWAPVVDGEGRPVGFVSEAALLRLGPGGRVGDAMERVALAVPDTAALGRAAALMSEHGVERVAVVAGDGALVGVLSALDVVAWLARGDGPLAVSSRPGPAPARGR